MLDHRPMEGFQASGWPSLITLEHVIFMFVKAQEEHYQIVYRWTSMQESPCSPHGMSTHSQCDFTAGELLCRNREETHPLGQCAVPRSRFLPACAECPVQGSLCQPYLARRSAGTSWQCPAVLLGQNPALVACLQNKHSR